jgi:pilus assembly protein CpaE
MNPNQTARTWRTQRRQAAVQLYLSGAHGDTAALLGVSVAGFPLNFILLPVGDDIDPQEISGAAATIVQVDPDSAASVERFKRLAAATEKPLIAAAFEPPLALVRALVRAGAHDVIPLPLDAGELEASLAPIRDKLFKQDEEALASSSKLVSVIKSVGGVGATALLSQLAIRFAAQEAAQARSACLVDFDVQFGDIAFQLGLRPKLSLADLINAGTRLDGALLRSTTTDHASGLHVIAAPPEMLPLEAISSEQAIDLVELAKREFGTVFVDLPANWTNWSLSLLAQSDLVLLVTELSVASLHRARRQIDLIHSQELDKLDVRVVVNRFEKGLLRTIRESDVREALGREISYTISNDAPLMRSAVDQGVPIAQLKRKSSIGKDIDTLDAGIAAAFELRR